MGQWFYDNIYEPGKLPLLLCLAAFVGTFVATRVITRLIRAGVGPFKDNVSESGLHVHHAVPGIILLILGAVMAVAAYSDPWIDIAGVLVGIGASLILDEFALILHLEDVYWTNEGRVSVEMIGLTAACLGFVVLGINPFGNDGISVDAFGVQVALTFGYVLHYLAVFICILKGKYRAALIGCFIPLVDWVCAVRMARPNSIWARRLYKGKRLEKAQRRADTFDRRYGAKWRWLSDTIAGSPSLPDPPAPAHADGR